MKAVKTVLITGGARRLGKELVLHFHRQGWRVLFTCQRSFEEGTALVTQLGHDAHCLRTPVSTQSNACVVANWAFDRTHGLDLIVCNGSTFRRASVEDTMPDDFGGMLQANVMGPFFLVQQCLELLKKRGGSVVNIADAQATQGVANFSAYLATKAALISLTKSMAVELAPQVRVNAVLPGSLPWPEEGDAYSQEAKVAIEAAIPAGELGRWSDVVQAVDYLASARYVTGACLHVDGGRSARY